MVIQLFVYPATQSFHSEVSIPYNIYGDLKIYLHFHLLILCYFHCIFYQKPNSKFSKLKGGGLINCRNIVTKVWLLKGVCPTELWEILIFFLNSAILDNLR